MALNGKATYGISSFGVGMVLAILFGILAIVDVGGQRVAYIGALVVCVIAGIVGLIMYFQNK